MTNYSEVDTNELIHTDPLRCVDHNGNAFDILGAEEFKKLPYEDDGFVKLFLVQEFGDGGLTVRKPTRLITGLPYPKKDGEVEIRVPSGKDDDAGLFNNAKAGGRRSPFSIYVARSRDGSRGDAYVATLAMNTTSRPHDPEFGRSAPDVCLVYEIPGSGYLTPDEVESKLKGSERYKNIKYMSPSALFRWGPKLKGKDYQVKVWPTSRSKPEDTIPLEPGDELRVKTKLTPGMDDISGYTIFKF